MPEEQEEEVILVECGICHEKVDSDDMKCTDDGTDMCKTCYEDRGITFECVDCGAIFNRGSEEVIEVEEGDICSGCRDAHYFYCEDCDKYIHEDISSYSVRDGQKMICESCFNHGYGACECGWVDRDDRLTYHDNRYWCESCYGEDLVSCEQCGNTMYTDDAIHTEDECLCGRCHRRSEDRVIHDYAYQPDYVFYHMEGEAKIRKPLYLGLELEVEGNEKEDIQNKAKRLMEWMKSESIEKYYYFKTDGSLSNGFEICAMPMSLKFIKKNSKLKAMTEWMKNNGLSSYTKGTCGFHIHMSREYFKGNEIGKMRGFFASCYAMLWKFSKRGESSSFCQKENYGIREFKENIGQSGRYWALNCNTHKATFEVRIFRGTLNYKRLMASIEFVQAISEYVKYVGFSSVFMIGKYNAYIWGEFLNWVKREGRFQQFFNYYTNRCTK